MVRRTIPSVDLEASIKAISNFRLAILAAVMALIPAVAPAADWRQEIGTFRIGLLAANAPTAPGLAALRRSYSAALGMPVDFFIARDFATLIDAQASSRIEYAIYSATSYATIAELCQCVEPVAAAVDIDGVAGIRSILIIRKGTVRDIKDIARVKLVVPPLDSIPGWLAPLSLLGKEGFNLRRRRALCHQGRFGGRGRGRLCQR